MAANKKQKQDVWGGVATIVDGRGGKGWLGEEILSGKVLLLILQSVDLVAV